MFKEVFILSTFLTIISSNIMVHSVHMKIYNESYAPFKENARGFEKSYRYLPVSLFFPSERYPKSYIQEFGLLHTGVINDLEGITGCTHDFVPKLYKELTLSNAFGLMPPQITYPMLNGHIIDTLNGKYIIVGRGDKKMLGFLESNSKYRKFRDYETTVVYENIFALKKYFWATKTLPFEKTSYLNGVWNKKTGQKDVYVKDLKTSKSYNQGTISSIKDDNSSFSIETENKEGGTSSTRN